LCSDRIGVPESFFWNGRSYSLTCASSGKFATAPAPQKMDDAIDTLRARYKLDAPGADLLFSDPYNVLTEDATSGRYLGVEFIDGVKVHHLAYSGKDVDFQIWILDGPRPLPVRYTIVSKKEPSQPQFTVQLTRWNPDAVVTDSDFRFTPPTGATPTASFPL